MSAIARPTEAAPSWKNEVNRRIAEHKSRKGSVADTPQAPREAQHTASRRAAEAAARVAARYAKTPSYSEMLASEARAVVRAAEAASRAAIEAQVAAESVLAGIEAITDAERLVQPALQPALRPGSERLDGMRLEPAAGEAFFSTVVSAVSSADSGPIAEVEYHGADSREKLEYAIRWDRELPALPVDPPEVHAMRGTDIFGLRIEEWRNGSALDGRAGASDADDVEVVEPALPIHANLIEFPRELVAARKARPRLAEGPLAAAEPGTQLSIFEVDPGTISTDPAGPGFADQDSTSWAEPRWSAVELEPQAAYALDEALDEMRELPAHEPTAAQLAFDLAPMHRRLLAGLVDGALIVGAVLFAASIALNHARQLPGIHALELGSALGLAVAATLYQALFLTLASATPGMRYAHIRLTSFDDQNPTRAQRTRRLGALLLSILPVGLGMAWSIFDEDHLSWHDRFSRTYPKSAPL